MEIDLKIFFLVSIMLSLLHASIKTVIPVGPQLLAVLMHSYLKRWNEQQDNPVPEDNRS